MDYSKYKDCRFAEKETLPHRSGTGCNEHRGYLKPAQRISAMISSIIKMVNMQPLDVFFTYMRA